MQPTTANSELVLHMIICIRVSEGYHQGKAEHDRTALGMGMMQYDIM